MGVYFVPMSDPNDVRVDRRHVPRSSLAMLSYPHLAPMDQGQSQKASYLSLLRADCHASVVHCPNVIVAQLLRFHQVEAPPSWVTLVI